MSPLLGCIADDLTGATDLALTLVRAGLSTTQVIGVPNSVGVIPNDQAIVVSLKSRTLPVAEAVEQSLSSLRLLKEAGAKQFFFKYCSTFDSTDEGNIGPVTDALLKELGSDFTIACPAFPANGRTVYSGHLFVHGTLLEQSSLRDHPLTPMTDSNLMRVLSRQTKLAVGLLGYEDVNAGVEPIRKRLKKLRKDGAKIVITDALSEAHVNDIGYACGDLPLVTGGSAVALGVANRVIEEHGTSRNGASTTRFVAPRGRTAILAGSCSEATRAQVALASELLPSLRLDVAALLAGEPIVEKALAFAKENIPHKPVIIYSSADGMQREATEKQYGKEHSGAVVETALAQIAQGLRELGTTRFVVAGGETSGAVVAKLGVQALRIGPEIDPGVPWTSTPEGDLALALKSGNFGTSDFFVKAMRFLP